MSICTYSLKQYAGLTNQFLFISIMRGMRGMGVSVDLKRVKIKVDQIERKKVIIFVRFLKIKNTFKTRS